MPDTLKLEIITPQATVFSEDVHMVTLPAIDGEMGVYAHHMRLITQLVPGEVIVTRDGQDRYLAVGEGLVEVAGDHVAIVTDMAIPSDKIDEAKVEAARERAAARLREKISDEEVAAVNASLARSLAQLQVRRRRRL
jgi:F-type H+-transporting ATPase subunit epsilon